MFVVSLLMLYVYVFVVVFFFWKQAYLNKYDLIELAFDFNNDKNMQSLISLL